jgi:hypothetical protein
VHSAIGWLDYFLIFYKKKTPIILYTRTSWEGGIGSHAALALTGRCPSTLLRKPNCRLTRLRHLLAISIVESPWV